MKFIHIYILLFHVLLSANQLKIGTIYTADGHIQIISDDKDIGASKGIVGRSIYSNDIIRTISNAKCKIIYDDRKTMLIIDSSSEIKLSDTKKSRSIHVNYGSFYLRNASKSRKKTMIFSETNQIKLSASEVWMNSIVGGGDEIYVLSGEIEAFNYTNESRATIVNNNVLYSYKDGFFESIEYSSSDIPQYVSDKVLLSFNQKINPYPFTVKQINYRSHDLIPLFGIGKWTEKTIIRPQGLGIDLSTGLASIADVSYNKIGIYPRYHTENFKIKLNLDGYIGPDQNLNEFDILNYLSYMQISNSRKNLILQIGPIHGLTFGHGNILKEYSNMLDYPRTRKVGAYLFWRTDNRDLSLDIFTSSIKEFGRGGGLFGLHTSLFVSEHFPLTIGFSYVQDLNQFSGLEDFINNEGVLSSISNMSRTVKGIGFDYTFDLFNSYYLDGYLFGEGVGMFFPETLYYIRTGDTFESEPGNEEHHGLSAEMKLERGGSWELVNGINLKYRNNWDIKTSFNIASAIHMPQYFGSTYEFERVRYNQAIDWEVIRGGEEITDMYEKFKISENSDTTKFLFPKEIYMMSTGTQIKFPAIGGNLDVTYHFREIIDFNGSISYYKEALGTDSMSDNNAFYNYHFGVDLLDNVFEGVSEARLYYTQFFTNKVGLEYSENFLRGVKVGIKVWKNISLLVDVHDVFYDIDLNNEVDLIRTATAELELRF